MFARILAAIGLILAVVFSTGCAHRVTTTVGPDGTRSTTSETRWVPSAYVAPLIYAPAPSYGRDYYYGGRPSYDPAVPVPHVVYGEMLNGTMRAARVNGVWRMCDTRSTAPNFCSRIMDAYGWPELTVGWRR